MIYDRVTVIFLSPTCKVILREWWEVTGARLWRLSLLSDAQTGWYEGYQPPAHTSPTPKANKPYNIPSVAALIKYFHAAAGFPLKLTWLADIKDGNYALWPVLTCAHAEK